MQKATSWKEFPYGWKKICYIEQYIESGEMVQVDILVGELDKAYKRVVKGETKLYAAVPGNYKTDLFEIDDILLFGAPYKLPRE